MFTNERICGSQWSSEATVCTFTAVHRSEPLSSVNGPAHLCGNTEVAHHARVNAVPAGQDHLGSGDRQNQRKAYLNLFERPFCSVISSEDRQTRLRLQNFITFFFFFFFLSMRRSFPEQKNVDPSCIVLCKRINSTVAHTTELALDDAGKKKSQ